MPGPTSLCKESILSFCTPALALANLNDRNDRYQNCCRCISVFLQVKHIDLLQLHWWDYDVPGLLDVVSVLADLQAQGLIRSIGVTNINTFWVEKMTDADIPLVSNQVGLCQPSLMHTFLDLLSAISPCLLCPVSDAVHPRTGQDIAVWRLAESLPRQANSYVLC